MLDLWQPLVYDVALAVGVGDVVGEQEDVGLGVRQGSQPVIVILTRRVPVGELQIRVVEAVENSRDVIPGEVAIGLPPQKAGLS